MNRNTKNIQEGFFSIEAMGSGFYWLIGMILAFSAVGVLYSLSGSNQEIQNINQLLQVARHLKSKGNYGTDGLITQMKELDLIQINTTTEEINNNYGGKIKIIGNNSHYFLESTKIPKSDCVRLSTNISRGSLVGKTKINGTEISGEVSATAAATGCNSLDNTITFYTKS